MGPMHLADIDNWHDINNYMNPGYFTLAAIDLKT